MPAAAARIRDEARKWNAPEPAIELLVDGLRKAGLVIPDESAATQ